MNPDTPASLSIPEDELIHGLKQGQPEAWETLCITYGEPLFLYAYHRCGQDADAAGDIRQETLLAAVDAISHYRGETPLFGWLCGIARHKAGDILRHRQRQGVSLEAVGEAAIPADRQPVWEAVSLNPAEEHALSSEMRSAIIQALWSLPGDYRLSLISRYVQGEAVELIARKLKRSYKATESLLSRARFALRKCLQENDNNGSQNG
ncbi:MAG: RNA polymerase sigma factor [Chloroflexi bacterium]|nr:RNA polymerase sigma factor [Chloroflexota bacterium]